MFFSHLSVESWADISRKAVFNGEHECNSGLQLRLLCGNILQQVYTDINNQVKSTQAVFHRRLDETKDAKNKMEATHAQVNSIPDRDKFFRRSK